MGLAEDKHHIRPYLDFCNHISMESILQPMLLKGTKPHTLFEKERVFSSLSLDFCTSARMIDKSEPSDGITQFSKANYDSKEMNLMGGAKSDQVGKLDP